MATDKLQVNGTCLKDDICCGSGCCDPDVSCCNGVDCLSLDPVVRGCDACTEYLDAGLCDCNPREEQCGIGESPCGDLCCNDATEICNCTTGPDAECVPITPPE